jgi:hypothetical protein
MMDKSSQKSPFYRHCHGAWILLVIILTAFAVFFLGNRTSSAVAAPISGQKEQSNSEASQGYLQNSPHGILPRSNRISISIYDPTLALAQQLPTLKADADRGNPYATCVLAWALDMCAQNGRRFKPDDYSDISSEQIDDARIGKLAEKAEFRDTAEIRCDGIDQDNFQDLDKVLLQSALMGHSKSMTRFALGAAQPGIRFDISRLDFAIAYRKNAETMLNRAAETGDPDAIAGVAFAYSSGYIRSDLGQIPVKEDPVKSIAAQRVLGAIRRHKNNGNKENSADDAIESSVISMNTKQLSRLTQLESAYLRAYQNGSATGHFGNSQLDRLPERACATALNSPE